MKYKRYDGRILEFVCNAYNEFEGKECVVLSDENGNNFVYYDYMLDDKIWINDNESVKRFIQIT